MLPMVPESLQPILNLSKARALLLDEAARTMPEGAWAQRDHTIATLERLIGNALATTGERLPPMPEGLNASEQEAWRYLVQAVAQPATPTGDSPYAHLQQAFADYSDLYQANEIIIWIKRSGCMPELEEKHSTITQDASAGIGIFQHRIMTAPQIKDWLNEAEAASAALDAVDRRNLALMRRRWMEMAGLDEALVSKLSRAIDTSHAAWIASKAAGEFDSWLHPFEEVVRCVRKKGEAIGKRFGISPYEALLSSVESNPGLTNATVNRVFGELRTTLPSLVADVMQKQANEPAPLPLPDIPMAQRLKLKQRLMKDLGLDANHVVLGTDTHPCMLGQWDDIRITTRRGDTPLLNDILALIHESGHAIYGGALPRERKGQPVGEYESLWVHESQSLFWEKQVACSREFMDYLSRVLTEELGANPAFAPENLYTHISRVKPSLNRVEADEVTYPAHIIMRHDLEQKLIDGSLAPKDVPVAWNQAMQEMLHISVPDNAQGCMQDVHWPRGAFGYFPSYTFGALAAAQLMETLKTEQPNIGDRIRNGDFAPIREWLNARIHQHGAYHTGEALIEQATGKPLSANAWLNHIHERYLGESRTPQPGDTVTGRLLIESREDELHL